MEPTGGGKGARESSMSPGRRCVWGICHCRSALNALSLDLSRFNGIVELEKRSKCTTSGLNLISNNSFSLPIQKSVSLIISFIAPSPRARGRK